ncbi:hypothetical protein R3W88_022807 [Solanum pinnatisectum]|uniref:Uncharacterized protein n=1 Tax=Solanum pinnatisectum TaxID=50273 RepID=A0AAV9LVM9_9SOLN|nr:hypothetical protein R3W88_022807 [Solanum pinnatisectum]
MARTRGGTARGDALGPMDRASAWGRRRPRGRGRAAAHARDREEEPQIAYVPPQPVGLGPAQPPLAPAATPDLHALLTQILATIGEMRQAPTPAPALAPAPQGQPPPVYVAVQPDLKNREMPLHE